MKTLKVLKLFFIWCATVTLVSAQQFNLEFSVVGTGGDITSIGPDTLILTLGQPFSGEGLTDSNNASGFLYQYSGGPISGIIGLYSVIDGWNMVSVPRSVSDYSKTVLFPSAFSNAFAYQGSYVIKSTLANGDGYWLKFSGSQTVSMIGDIRNRDTVNVNPGWNMIGSISQSIPVTSLTSIPSSIVTSNFFGFQGSYFIISTIEPGNAYWVKVNQAGKLILSSTGAIGEANNRITIIPTNDLPPSAPVGKMEEVVPKVYALHQNYPNPFNPSTTIQYDLPRSAHAVLTIYNVLGEEVKTLVDEMQEAGYKSVEWDASTVSSGIYFYRLVAGTFSDVRRMMIIK